MISILDINFTWIFLIQLIFVLIDPLRAINSYNHGLPIENEDDTVANNDKNNNYHFSTSYEYEPRNIDDGMDEYKGR